MSALQTRKLCEVCKDLSLGKRPAHDKEKKLHHSDILAMHLAVKRGCPLCARIWSTLAEEEPGSPRSAEVEETLLKKYAPGVAILYRIADDWTPREIHFWIPKVVSQADLIRSESMNWMFRLQITHTTLYFVVGCEDNKSAPPLGRFLKPTINTGSPQAIDLCKGWINYCVENHSSCTFEATNGSRLPTRLISTIATREAGRVHLCDTKSLSSQTPYLTLSHRWGDQINTTLTTKNLNALLQGIFISELPKTFQDAIYFAKSIGIGYLWIDSLCIIQDSEQDWRRESALMATVYSNAWCNLAADGASKGLTGLFFDRDPDLATPLTIDLPSKSGQGGTASTASNDDANSLLSTATPSFDRCVFLSRFFWEHNVEMSALNRRAWILQERLLTKRAIHFTRDQLFFECREFGTCEMYPDGLPRCISTSDSQFFRGIHFKSTFAKHQIPSNPSDKWLSAYSTWGNLVSVYSQCHLSFDKDKLVAISGLARVMKDSFKCDYLAGVWRENLDLQLLWSCVLPESPRSTRLSDYTAPTWSWASVNCVCQFHTPVLSSAQEGSGVERLITIKDAVVETIDGDEMGLVLHGFLRLVSKLIPVNVNSAAPSGSFHQIDVPLPDRDAGQLVAAVRWDVVPYSDTRDRLEGIHYVVPITSRVNNPPNGPLSYVEGIILRNNRGSKGQYRRVGQFVCLRAPVSYLKARASREEREMMTEDKFEAYDDATDLYTFTIV